MTPLTAHVLSATRVGLYLLLTLSALPFQMLFVALGLTAASRFPPHYHRLVLRIFGFRISRRGAPAPDRPTLFVANHSSYLDIEVLASIVEGGFVAKSEVAQWPLFGLLAKLQRCVFVDRKRRSAGDQRDSLATRLVAGDSLILFPEGTSNDGLHIRPFKSALFAAAEQRIDGRPVTVQPVSVTYVSVNGIPLGRDLRPSLAWYGDMDLAGHLWHMTGLGIIGVAVLFHPTVTIDQFGSRKKLAEHCQRVIVEGVALANAGRLPQAAPSVPPAPALPAHDATVSAA